MQALVYHGPNQLRYEKVPDPIPKKGEVKLRVKAVGICGSDVHGYLGLTGRRIPPMIMGHEFSGVVEELGPEVSGVRVGDRVAGFPFGFDGTCPTCQRGDFTHCENRILYGVLTDNGANADYLSVTQGGCIPLAEQVSFAEGALIEPLTVGYHAVSHVPDAKLAGKTIFLVGAGTIGLMTLACLKMKNPAQIIVSDLGANRLRVAKQMGADHVLDPKAVDVVAKVRDLTHGLGADVVFEAVGASVTVQQAMSALRPEGTAVWIGNNQKMVEVNMQEVVTRELTILGTNAFSLNTFKTAADLVNSGRVNVKPLLSHQAPMGEGAKIFAQLAKDPGEWIKVVLVN